MHNRLFFNNSCLFRSLFSNYSFFFNSCFFSNPRFSNNSRFSSNSFFFYNTCLSCDACFFWFFLLLILLLSSFWFNKCLPFDRTWRNQSLFFYKRLLFNYLCTCQRANSMFCNRFRSFILCFYFYFFWLLLLNNWHFFHFFNFLCFLWRRLWNFNRFYKVE